MYRRSIFFFVAAALAVAVVTAGCGRGANSRGADAGERGKETAQAESVQAPEAKDAAQADVAGDADGVQHKVLSFNLEGFSDKGEKKWDVTGTCAEAISPTEVKLDQIVAKAYGDEGEATITADEGIYDKAKNNVRLAKNVKATIQNTEGVDAGFLDFGTTAEAEAAEVSEEERAAAKKGKKRNTVITCDGDVCFNYEEDVAFFNENVKVVTDDGTIIADMITVNLDPDTKKVKTIEATGHVKIFQEGNTIYSDRATYIEADKKIILSGRPKIIIESEEGGFDTNFMAGSDLPTKPGT